MISLEEAQNLVLQKAKSFGKELLALEQAYGRVLAEAVVADRDYPPFNRSAMDGYAIDNQDFNIQNIRQFRCIETIHAGKTPAKTLAQGECYRIMTGAAVPPCADAVIRVEDSHNENEVISFNISTLKAWQNIARQGEDVRESLLLLPIGTRIRAAEACTLATVGKAEVWVERRPKVAIISTGDEVQPVSAKVGAVQIRDANRYTLSALLAKEGIEVIFSDLVKDEEGILKETIARALSVADVVLISGGVSMGEKDLVPSALAACGVEKVFHKMRVKPGKPVWFGQDDKHKTVFALPGNPLSCMVIFKLLVAPFLRKSLGDKTVFAPLRLPFGGEKRVNKSSLDECFPIIYFQGDNATSVKPLIFNGSGDIRAAATADGLAIQRSTQGQICQGDLVEVLAF